MNRPLFVSLDGPKGTGKTTLLEAVTAVLRADNKKVIRLCERKSDPDRGATMALVNELARNHSRDLEWTVCQRFADSRSWISRHVLTEQPPGSIILIDRWYPSDAAFRQTVPFAEILQLNIDVMCGCLTCMLASSPRRIFHGPGLRHDPEDWAVR